MKLKVITRGSLCDIKVVDAETNEQVEGVQRAVFEAARGEFPRIVLTIDIFEVEAESMTTLRMEERRGLGIPDIPPALETFKQNPYKTISDDLADVVCPPSAANAQ